MHRSIAALAAVSLCAAGLAACGSNDTASTPSPCLRGPANFLTALATAPGPVRLDHQNLISDCVLPAQKAGELTQVGSALVIAATKLNVAGRANPTGNDPVELGYLVGAVERGAEDTAGIHADLLRRLDSAARFSPGALPPAFATGYATGLAAGKKSG
jgi:hypothetical protein